MNSERWMPVKGYEGLYEVSNLGRVKSLPRKNFKTVRFLKPYVNKVNGYVYIQLCKNNHPKAFRLHRLVYESFTGAVLDGYDANRQIDHINGDKTDNRLENLELVTQSENVKRAFANGQIRKVTKKVICLDDGNVFESMTDAVASVGGKNVSAITKVCRGERSQYRNKHFAYYEDYLNGTIPKFSGRAKESCEKLWAK